jgi:hypothetical protein
MADFPALTGEVVTERHARICRERGHARHTIEIRPGERVNSDRCPRCGDYTGRDDYEED